MYYFSGYSAVNQLEDIYNSFCKAVDAGREVYTVFCDINKGFDRLWYKCLFFKLQTVGITGPFLQWLTGYPNNKRQRVVFQGAFRPLYVYFLMTQPLHNSCKSSTSTSCIKQYKHGHLIGVLLLTLQSQYYFPKTDEISP